MDITPEILEKLQLIREKYAAMGQDMGSYLDGLLYSNYLTYWDYIHLETLMSLQTPRTDFPDEQIFIIYHQITELYFKLIQLELDQLQQGAAHSAAGWKLRIGRSVGYFKNLCHSFDVMVHGMQQEQFLKFRMSLLPASGFQSAQFREIEIKSTDFWNLLKEEGREGLNESMPLEDLYENIYWKFGNIEMKTGQKTLTLKMFEQKYDPAFKRLAQDMRTRNLWALFQELPAEIQQDETLRELLREYDLYANVFWRLSHYKSAVRYLQRDPEVISATGGTNWQKYLPPRFQRVIYFPGLWSETERGEWGKAWVMSLFAEKVETQWGKKG